VALRRDLDFSVWNPDSNVSNYKLVEPNDFVIGLRSFQHGIAHSTVRGLVSPAYTVLRAASKVEQRFYKYYFRSNLLISQLANITQGIRQGQAIDIEAFQNLRMPLPPLEEQRRIADFLDVEIARLDQVGRARGSQSGLLSLLLRQLVDGALAGDSGTLKKLGITADNADWGTGKVSRICEVIPGYAFPSDGFLHAGGTRLLRGVNVSVDQTSWEDCVSWDEERAPTPERFHLRVGDLVLGMDRPWISKGMRIAFISDEDLPALLLQRVACLRSKSAGIDIRYIYWSLRSSRFRQAVEGELTGVSVPHLSGDQIGGFSFPVPPLPVQKAICDQLAVHSARIHDLQSTMDRQTQLLAERRQALITAAVTGQFDVSTASGRNVTEGVTV
jgi:type I restriction enzyme S subunit